MAPKFKFCALMVAVSAIDRCVAQAAEANFSSTQQECPSTTHDLRFMLPSEVPENNSPNQCPTDPAAPAYCEAPPCGGGCTGGLVCNLDTRMCQECTSRHCCVTMPASKITAAIESAFLPGGSPLAASRLQGPVLVYVRPCPRNYHCEKGRVDDYRNSSSVQDPTRDYIPSRDSQCYNRKHHCSASQGCPEGTAEPESGSSKWLAVLGAILWYAIAKTVRLGVYRARSIRHAKQDSEGNQGLLSMNAMSLEAPGADLQRVLSSPAQRMSSFLQFSIERQRDDISMSALLESRHGNDTSYSPNESGDSALTSTVSLPELSRTPTESLDANDPLISSLERKAAALVSEGGKAQGLNLEFEDLSLTLPDGNVVLHGVTGTLKSGRLCAIMGPSGAGKTTLLFTLCGKATYGQQTGALKINGKNATVADYRNSFGFVPQEDVMLRSMTVSEICQFSASMRLPPTFSPDQCRRVAETVIDVLGMSHIKHSAIGDEETRGISGGQRKRVNIAMELVAKPSILFLDEPTSGLDATSSLQLVKALRATAKQGITVAAVLHQPRYEMFCLFHDVLLLGKGGFTVYLGPAVRAKAYFESLGYTFPSEINPADYLLDIIAGDVNCLGDSTLKHTDLPAHWQRDTVFNQANSGDAKLESPLADLDAFDPMERQPTGFASQLRLFTKRGLIQQYRPLRVVVADYSLIFLAGALLGMSQRNTELTQLPVSGALSGMAIGLTTIISSTRCFGNERIVFWRETSSGSNRLAYFLGKNISELPRLVFIPFFYLMIFQAFTSVSDDSGGFSEFVILLAAVWAVSGLGYCVSLSVSPSNSQLAGVLVVLVSMMLNGVFVESARMGGLKDIQSFSFAYHMTRGIYLLKVAQFPDYQVPNTGSGQIKFTSNMCPIDQVCLGWISLKDSLVQQFQFGNPACSFHAEEKSCYTDTNPSGIPCEVCGAGQIHLDSLGALVSIGLAARAIAFAALCFTNREKQV